MKIKAKRGIDNFYSHSAFELSCLSMSDIGDLVRSRTALVKILQAFVFAGKAKGVFASSPHLAKIRPANVHRGKASGEVIEYKRNCASRGSLPLISHPPAELPSYLHLPSRRQAV